MVNSTSHERPPKRAKLDNDGSGANLEPPSTVTPAQHDLGVNTMVDHAGNDDHAKELEVGITAFIDASRKTFQGILKKRYTDFLVNEILPDGSVLHLRQMNTKSLKAVTEQVEAPSLPSNEDQNEVKAEASVAEETTSQDSKPRGQEATSTNPAEAKPESEAPAVSDEDRAKLVEYFNEEAVSQLISLYESILRHPGKKPREHPTVRTAFTSDRSIRSQIHEDIRRIFSRKIESSTDQEGVLVLTASSNDTRGRQWGKSNEKGGRRPGKLGWLDRGGEYVHFTLYKENKDTLEIISALARQLKTTNKTFQFAGTKDRRAVTVQRVSAYRVEAERLAGLNRSLRFAGIGDFQYQIYGLELGDLKGNEFVITLRDCKLDGSDDGDATARVTAAKTYLSESLRGLHDKGFLNYYGLQRFGTFATRTDVVGLKILKGDFKGACEDILSFSPVALQSTDSLPSGTLVGQDDRARAEGINIWKTSGKVGEALDKIPRKFSAEVALIRHLSKRRDDHLGALLSIQRNLRLMYVHAYQSLIWNLAVGERWRLFGGAVVEGDLVLVREHKEKEERQEVKETVDADGELVIEPTGEDRAYDPDDVYERARPLTAAEAASGQYSIFDVVLPQPGFDVLYPANASGEWYKSFMATEAGGGLDPYDMRRKQKDFSLSGGYRKVLARIGEDFEAQVHEYWNDDQQFVDTDMDRIKGKSKQGEKSGEPSVNDGQNGNGASDQRPKLAAVLKFQLGSSQYATMALRELSKGGIQAYKPEFMGGR